MFINTVWICDRLRSHRIFCKAVRWEQRYRNRRSGNKYRCIRCKYRRTACDVCFFARSGGRVCRNMWIDHCQRKIRGGEHIPFLFRYRSCERSFFLLPQKSVVLVMVVPVPVKQLKILPKSPVSFLPIFYLLTGYWLLCLVVVYIRKNCAKLWHTRVFFVSNTSVFAIFYLLFMFLTYC